MDRCGRCSKKCAGFKRCSVCKDIWYCETACQNADWTVHKKKCRRPAPQDVSSPVLLQECERMPLRKAMEQIVTAQG